MGVSEEFQLEARSIVTDPQLLAELEDALWWMGMYLDSQLPADGDRWRGLAELQVRDTKAVFVELLHYAADMQDAMNIGDVGEQDAFILEMVARQTERLEMQVRDRRRD